MWRLAYLSVLLLSISSCFRTEKLDNNELNEVEYHNFHVKYAKGFSVFQIDGRKSILIHEPSSGQIIDSLDITAQTSDKIRFFPSVIAQSTTHFAFFNAIGILDNLTGLCGIQYLDDAQKKLVKNTAEICSAQGLDIEKVVNINPDLVFLYPFGDKDKEQLEKLGVRNLFLTEYLEESPLARAEWLKFYALIAGVNPNKAGFDEIERDYVKLKQRKTNSIEPTVVFNLPFGETWDMPSGNSISARLVKDAGMNYIFEHKKNSGNLLFKLEEAYNFLSKAECWIIIAARPERFSLDDLKKENRIYSSFPSVKNNKVFFCNTQTTPYFSEGPIEPHIMLRDLITCLEGDDSDNKYFKILC